jgi:hypothetical protein
MPEILLEILSHYCSRLSRACYSGTQRLHHKITINSPLLLFVFPPASTFFLFRLSDNIVYIYYHLQQKFRYTAREFKRLDSITKSPIYQLFTEAINGLETIRAYKMEGDMAKQIERMLEQNSRAWYLNFSMNRWYISDSIGDSITKFR